MHKSYKNNSPFVTVEVNGEEFWINIDPKNNNVNSIVKKESDSVNQNNGESNILIGGTQESVTPGTTIVYDNSKLDGGQELSDFIKKFYY